MSQKKKMDVRRVYSVAERSIVMLRFIFGIAMVLKFTDATTIGIMDNSQDAYQIKNNIEISTNSIILSGLRKRSLTSEIWLARKLETKLQIDGDKAAFEDSVTQRSHTINVASTIPEEYGNPPQILDIKSRWFPKESLNKRLKQRRLKEEKNQERDDGNSIGRRVKRSLTDLWYFDYEYDFGYEDNSLDYCDYPPCPVWTEWHGSGICDVTCGGGQRLLVRYCNNSRTDEIQGGCEGESTKLEDCNTQACPVWSDWSPESQCSETCGVGVQKFTRNCTVNDKQSQGCVGTNFEYRSCSSPSSCPPQWTNWSRYGLCTKSCGSNGVQVRRRLCAVNGKPARGKKVPCNGHAAEQRPCPGLKWCSARFSKWTAWSQCNAITCDSTGFQRRTRRCLGLHGEVLAKYRMNCTADQLVQEKQCRAEPCSRVCTLVLANLAKQSESATPTWSQWTEWSDCSVSCGLGGMQTRSRMCFAVQISPNGTIIMKDDKTCNGDAVEGRRCHFNIECPHWDFWQKWEACSRPCGFQGRRRRTRQCIADIYEPFNAGEEIESTKIFEKNDMPFDAADNAEGSSETEGSTDDSDWENLPRITMYSGGLGIHRQKRKIIRRVYLNDHWCEGGTNSSTMVGSCNHHPCLPRWGRWSAWGDCSVTCGKGQMQRFRRCNGNGNCHGQKYEFKTCYRAPCWGEWSGFSPCTKSCGTGETFRSRQCKGMSNKREEFRNCEGPSKEKKDCNTQGCPKWSEWGSWGNCSVACDGGTKLRTRECVNGVCNGRNNDVASCNFQPCPYWGFWSTWSCCSVTCGDGVKTRKRICRHGDPGVSGCEGNMIEEQYCNPSSCDVTTGPPIDSSHCGIKPKNRTTNPILKIFNGQISRDHEWPWQVSWQHHSCFAGNNDCVWEHLCGATLLGPKWVVTAGHCIEEWDYRVVHDDPSDKWSVVVGMTKLFQSGKRYFIRRVFLHPEYKYQGVPRNDIALLKLRDPVPITEMVSPACLPDNHATADDEQCFVTGWGNTAPKSHLSSSLRHASLPILNFETCQKLGNVYEDYLNKNWHMCAGDIKSTETTDSCRGDSGGPMVCLRPDGKWYLAGITSFGFKDCGTAGHAGIYVPMGHYQDWTKKTIEDFSRNGC